MGKAGIYRKHLMLLKGSITLIIVALCFTNFKPMSYYIIGIIGIILIALDSKTTDKQIFLLDQKIRELKALDNISRIIDEFPETHKVLINITKVVAEIVNFTSCVIMFYNEAKDELVTQASYGVCDEMLTYFSQEKGKGLERRVLENNESIATLNCIEGGCKVNLCKQHICFGVSVPLLYKNKIMGTLSIYNNEVTNINDSDKELLYLMSSRIGIILENDRLYKELMEKSITDSLTGLYNHKQFYERLRYEIDNAREVDQNLFILMVDIDRFKSFNDIYGHVVGDRVLVEVAKTIRNSIRETDVAARYGGEEFAIILTDTTYETATLVAERIKNSVKRIKNKIKSVEEGITVSIGIAGFPNCSDDTSTLVDIADVRMYKGKELGGDRIVS